jgi:hypothetical protein
VGDASGEDVDAIAVISGEVILGKLVVVDSMGPRVDAEGREPQIEGYLSLS